MIESGFPLLGLTSDYLPDYLMSGVTTNREWAAANNDLLVRALRGYIRTVHWLYDPANRDEALAILDKATGGERQYTERVYQMQVEELKLWPANGEIPESAVSGTLQVLKDEGK